MGGTVTLASDFIDQNPRFQDTVVASSRVGTGVNGLQYVCNKLIINSLPWTNAEYAQLRARLWRQGRRFDKVHVIIPVTHLLWAVFVEVARQILSSV